MVGLAGHYERRHADLATEECMRRERNGLRATALAAVIAALVLAVAAPQAQAADRVSVATDWSPHGMISGLLLAKQNGAFAAAGVDVDVLDGKGSTTTVQQVAA